MGFNIHILSGRNRSTNLPGHAALAASFNPTRFKLAAARSSPKLALEPQQRADSNKNKLRLLRGQAGRRGQALGKPAGGFRASSASRTPEGQPRAVADALATLTTPGADSSIKKL
jgi:hypothetical protein